MGAERVVWVTRTEPGAAATAARLKAIGFRPVVAPLLAVRALAASLSLDGVEALAFTSTNGVRAFVARTERRELPVFAVGDATARAARDAGFTDVVSANDNGAGLVRMIVRASPTGRVLCPGPRQRAGDVPGALVRAGIAAEALSLYETVPATTLPEAVRAPLADRQVGAVLIHSARAGEVFARLAASYDLTDMTVLGLSLACLRPLVDLDLPARVVAKTPREDALLDALLATLGKPSPAR